MKIFGQLKAAFLEKLAADPTSTLARIYYNTVTNKMKMYDGTSWKTVADTSSALTNPMTTTGDIIYSSDNSGTPARRAVGASGTVLHGGTTPTYSAVSLTADVTGALPLANGGTNATTKAGAFDSLSPMTTAGDIIIGGASGTGTRKAIGVEGQYLRVSSATPGYGWQSIGAKSADYPITDSDGYDIILMTTSTTNRTVTLPAAANNSGRVITIKKADNGTGSVIISGTIEGGTTNNTIFKQYGYCTVFSDGTGWFWQTDIQEAGTFSGVLSAASGGTMTVASSSYYYTRTGRLVFLEISVVDITTSGKSSTMTFTTMPFSSSARGAILNAAILYDQITTPASGVDLVANMVASTTSIRMDWNRTGAVNSLQLVVADLASATIADIQFSGSYTIAT